MTLSQSEWSAQIYGNIGHVVTHMVVILYATAVLHLPGVFQLTYGGMLGYASLGLVLFGVAALPAGWLGDRWSQVGMMIVFFIGAGVASIIVGLAHSPLQLKIGLSLIGLFAAIYHPVGIAWLIASATKQGMTLGVNGLFGGLGSALAAPFVGIMIDYASWRYAFVIPGAISIIAGLIMCLGWHRGTVVDARADQSPTVQPSLSAQRRAFIVLTLTMACAGFVYAGLTHTMPKLFEQGLDTQIAKSYTLIGLYVGVVIGLSSLSSLLGGWLADRFSPRLTYLAFWVLTIVPLFFIPDVIGAQLIALVVFALAFNTGFAAAENMLVARYTPFEWRSVAYGSKFVLALGIGGLTVQLAGQLFDTAGDFGQLYLMMGAAAILATICSVMLPKESVSKTCSASVDAIPDEF